MLRTIQTVISAVTLSTLVLAGAVQAQDGNGKVDTKVPATAADHEALAKTYEEKAGNYRKEVEWHKSMAAAYAKEHPDTKGGAKNPWNVKMQKHCQQLAAAAEKLAKDTEKA